VLTHTKKFYQILPSGIKKMDNQENSQPAPQIESRDTSIENKATNTDFRSMPQEMNKASQNLRNVIVVIAAVGVGCFAVLCMIIAVLAVIYPYAKSAVPALPAPFGTPESPIVLPDFTETGPQINSNSIGKPDAPLKMLEYSDFQCPYCARFWKETEKQLDAAYISTGKLYYEYHSFGYFIGNESGRAAEAAYCAGDQGKFWEMHDIIFANQTGENVGDFADVRLLAFGDKIGVNHSDFQSCFNTGKYKARVEQDSTDGQRTGIKATPSFILSYTDSNGQVVTKLIEGAQPFSEFQTIIDAALAATAK
jgi:protein-disulfide isomerase